MKVLIWGLMVFLMVALVTIAGGMGIVFGGIPTALIAWLFYLLGRTLCTNYDFSIIAKKARAAGKTPADFVLDTIPDEAKNNILANAQDKELLKASLKNSIKGGSITRAEAKAIKAKLCP